MIRYLVKYNPIAIDAVRKTIYSGPSLSEAYKEHDDKMNEVRLAGPLTKIVVQKKEDNKISYLQITEVG